jgi:hypothetical protein
VRAPLTRRAAIGQSGSPAMVAYPVGRWAGRTTMRTTILWSLVTRSRCVCIGHLPGGQASELSRLLDRDQSALPSRWFMPWFRGFRSSGTRLYAYHLRAD